MKPLGTAVLACLAVCLPIASGWIIQQGIELPAGILACAFVLPFVKP